MAAKKLIIEVIEARNLLPKDGHGTSSPYVVVDFYGQRKRTQTVVRDLNPTWNETLEFNVVLKTGADQDPSPADRVFGDAIEIEVYHDKNYGPTTRHNHLGRVKLSSTQFLHVRKGEEALMFFPLEKKSLLSWVQGDLGLKIYYSDGHDFTDPPPPPSPPPSHQQTTNPPPPGPAPVDEGPKPDIPAGAAAPPTLPPDHLPDASPPPPDPELRTPGADPASENIPADQPPLPAPDDSSHTPPAAPPVLDPPPDTAASPMVAPVPQSPAPEFAPPTQSEINPPPPSTPKRGPLSAPPSPGPQWDGRPPTLIRASSVSGSILDVRVAGNDGIGPSGGLRPPPPLPPLKMPRTSSTSSVDSLPVDRTSFDLVEKMHYLFVRVVKARSLPTNGSPIVKIVVSGCRIVSNPARKTNFFEWDQTFAFGRESPESSSMLEVSVWDAGDGSMHNHFLGGICFDVTEIPLRDPPDSPLAPQWYRLEGGGAHMGDLMLATWVGTQADDSFPDAWKTDTAGHVNSKAKVYLSPKLWYLRTTVIDAQDVMPTTALLKEPSFQIKAQLGFQASQTKPATNRNGTLTWNEDLMLVAAEPFISDQFVTFVLEQRLPKGSVAMGIATVPLASIERRVDDRKVVPRWVTFEDPKHLHSQKRIYKGRVQLRLCFDGGYHVMDEAAHVCSDYRPTAKQLWKPAVGTVELGIIGCRALLPTKTLNGKGSTDAYAVAKYGPKWVRTRTVTDCLDPKWNEQYTWKVYDPCTVLSIGVFDSWGSGLESDDRHSKEVGGQPDFKMGKVRVRISTLQTGRVYRNMYPLLLLTPGGLRKIGDIELAVRFVRNSSTLDVLNVYSQPLLPLMHHIKPLGLGQQDMLRNATAKILAAYLSRSEPPLKPEVVLYMLDADSHAFSLRKIRANWLRIVGVIAGLIDVVRWIEDTRTWKNPTSTILVHALLVMLVWFPDLIIPTLAFYVFAIGAWNYRFRSKDQLPHFDTNISLVENIDREELDEEFDKVPSTRSPDVVRSRYDKLRTLGARAQAVLGDIATQGERVQALVTWRDPRATGIFIGLCFLVAMVLYLVPSKMVAMASGFYYLRHPMFRDRAPSPALNFFRRLPSQSDRIL